MINSNTGNNLLTVSLFGIIFGMIHFFGKEEEKRSQEMFDIQRKISNLSCLCKEMKEQLKNIQEQENTVKKFISLSDLSHKNVIDNNGVDYEECIEQYIEQFSEQCVEHFVNVDINKHDYCADLECEMKSDSERKRSNSLSSILGSAKKMVFGSS